MRPTERKYSGLHRPPRGWVGEYLIGGIVSVEVGVDRESLMRLVVGALEGEEWARGVWEGGSVAFGRADAWSDLDAVAVVRKGAVEQAFAAVEAALGEVELAYRLPEPTWHGHAQAFYRVAAAGPFRMVDLVVMQGEPDARFLVRERHGEPAVAFDKDGVIVARPLDWAAHREIVSRRVEAMRTTFPLFQPLVEKELRRGRDMDALSFYHGLCLRPLVELLRVRYVPERHDYGLRYLDEDLPQGEAERVRRLAFVGDPDALAACHREAQEVFAATLAAIDSRRG